MGLAADAASQATMGRPLIKPSKGRRRELWTVAFASLEVLVVRDTLQPGTSVWRD